MELDPHLVVVRSYIQIFIISIAKSEKSASYDKGDRQKKEIWLYECSQIYFSYFLKMKDAILSMLVILVVVMLATALMAIMLYNSLFLLAGIGYGLSFLIVKKRIKNRKQKILFPIER